MEEGRKDEGKKVRAEKSTGEGGGDERERGDASDPARVRFPVKMCALSNECECLVLASGMRGRGGMKRGRRGGLMKRSKEEVLLLKPSRYKGCRERRRRAQGRQGER